VQVDPWALRDSNPRPSPCKGEMNMQVKDLSRRFQVDPGTCPYLGVPVSCYANVMRQGAAARWTFERAGREVTSPMLGVSTRPSSGGIPDSRRVSNPERTRRSS
jgi:hypothetical protein